MLIMCFGAPSHRGTDPASHQGRAAPCVHRRIERCRILGAGAAEQLRARNIRKGQRDLRIAVQFLVFRRSPSSRSCWALVPLLI